MAWKTCLVACLLFCYSESANSPFTNPGYPGLQKIGVDRIVSRQGTDGTTQVETVPAAKPTPLVPFSDHNSDVQANHYPFYAADIELLIALGSLSLPHPQGGALNIVLQSSTTEHGSRTLHVLSNGYPGTITQRRNGFFATLATPEGTYTLENRGSVTHLIQQRQLDLRINPALTDYAAPTI